MLEDVEDVEDVGFLQLITEFLRISRSAVMVPRWVPQMEECRWETPGVSHSHSHALSSHDTAKWLSLALFGYKNCSEA